MDREQLWAILAALACWAVFFTLLLAGIVVAVIASTQRARRAFDRWMTPDPAELALRLDRLRQRHPGLSDEALVRQIIRDQSLKAGLVGAVTGLGGLVTLPIAIPVDFALSAQLQAALIHFIAQTYAPGQSAEVMRLQTYAIMAGQRLLQQASEASSRLAQAAVAKLLTRFLAETVAESLLKVVPFLGAAVGFVFNFATTRAVGNLAAKWYRGELRSLPKLPKGASDQIAKA